MQNEQTQQQDSAAMNSRGWWEDYFREKWEANRGREQTRHFMQRLIESLPEAEVSYLRSRPTEVLDWGCALGEGVKTFADQFPIARVAGLDFSATAIDSARRHYPDSEFLLTEGGEIPRPFDVIVTSNCLEHFERPLEVMERHLQVCRSVYIALVPYNEYPLCEYHRSQFREESFPRRVGTFVRLAAKVIDVDPSQWAGKQLLVVYGSDSYLRERAVSDTRELERQKWERYYNDAPLEEEDRDTRQFGEELVERLSQILPAGARVLEAGCGAGWQGLALARSGRFRVTMMDFSEAALAQARRLFEREKVAADFLCADAFTPGEPEFDLVFNAGVLEHYTPDEQAALLRGMASRSRRFVLALVPNRLCYWYWLWRLQKSGRGAWPFGKEVPLADLSQVFSSAGLRFAGQTFMGLRWTEGFIRALWGMDEALLEAALELHRSPLAPDAQRAYLVAGLGTVEAVGDRTYAGWSAAPFAEDRRMAEMSAALSDALALRVGADVQLTRLRGLLDERTAATQRFLEEAAQREAETARLRRQAEESATVVSAAREEARAAHEDAQAGQEEARAAREESTRLRESNQKLSERAESLQSELRAAQQKREALRAALAAEQHARQLLESTLSGSYGQVVERVRDLVHTVTPRGATVLVVSKGDPDLLRFDGRQGWHFPLAEGNQYAGHYPASSGEAVEHLEALRGRGANFIVFPNAAFWWLDHYREFKQYLNDRYARVAGDERCVIYRLSTGTGGGSNGTLSHTRLWRRVTNLLHGRRRPPAESELPHGTHQGNGAGANGHQPAGRSTAVAEAPVKVEKASPATRATPVSEPNEYDIVCFPIIDWDFRFQRPQQLATCFGAKGRRVFYLSHELRPDGEPYGLRERRPNVYEVSLRGPRQNVYKQVMTERAEEVLSESLDALRRDLSIEASVSLVQLPFWWPLARGLRDAHGWPVMYDCMDHHVGFSTNGVAMLEQEEELLRGADLVVASSVGIEREVRRYNPNVALVRNGCDYDHFAAPPSGPPPFPKKPGRPVVGYYGAIADWFDADLVADVAARRPEWDFVLVGSTHTADVTRLSKLPNVTLPGEKPYEQIPRWLATFDVAILPFKRVPLTEAANPVKAYEIFAAGKPLVSVPLPEVRAMGHLVRLAADADDFERQIAQVLPEKYDPVVVEGRRAFARNNTWQKRAAALEPILLEAVRRYRGGGRAAEVLGLVSVVLPVYNQANLLRESIESVLAQTYPQFELIVVNDGSTDGVEAVLDEYADHPKVRLLTQLNQKLPTALSNGFDFARGEFWTWSSADNLMHREQLARMVEFLRSRPEAAMVYADYLAIDDHGRPLRDPSFRPHNRRSPESPEIHLPRSTSELNRVKDNFIGACFMYRASAGRVLGDYDAKGLGIEDYDYWMRINNLFRIEHLGTDELLYQYRVHDNTLNARASELRIFDRADALMGLEKARGEFYAQPWTIHVDAPTAEWLGGVEQGRHRIVTWQGDGANNTGDGGKHLVLLHVDSLGNATAPSPPRAYTAVWFRRGDEASLPYLYRDRLRRVADACFAADDATADRLDLLLDRKVFRVHPGEELLRLALAAGNNGLFLRRTPDAPATPRQLPEAYFPPGRRLRVLLQADDFTQGGLENVVLDLAATLDPDRFDVALLVLGRRGAAADAARKARLEVLTFPDGPDREREYRRLLCDRRIDVVSAHYSHFGAEIAADLHVPFVQTIHNTYVWLSPEQVAEKQRAARFTSAFVCVSDNVAFYSDLRLGVPPGKTVVIANGVSLEKLRAADAAAERRRVRDELGLSDGDVVFLNVASIHPPKAQRELVAAFTRVATDYPSARLVLLGRAMDERYLDELRETVEARGLEGRVFFPGEREDVAAFYHAADAFVLPSFWEGWSLALTEAVCAGLPFIATDVGGARELLDATGAGRLLQPPFDRITDLDAGSISCYVHGEHPHFVDDLSAEMRRLIQRPPRPVLSREVVDRFGCRAAHDGYARLFQWLVQGGTPATARPWLRDRARLSPPAPTGGLRDGRTGDDPAEPVWSPSVPADATRRGAPGSFMTLVEDAVPEVPEEHFVGCLRGSDSYSKGSKERRAYIDASVPRLYRIFKNMLLSRCLFAGPTLDVASGWGILYPAVRRYFPRMLPYSIAEMSEPRASYDGDEVSGCVFECDKDVLAFGDSSFGTVMFFDCLEHLIVDPLWTLLEFNRVLRPGGHLILTTPNAAAAFRILRILNGGNPATENYIKPAAVYQRHNREWSPDEVARALKCCGFRGVAFSTNAAAMTAEERGALEGLAALGMLAKPVAEFGPELFVVAEKQVTRTLASELSPDERWPEWLYTSCERYRRRPTHYPIVVGADYA